jgi:hypothetical protein
VSRSAPGSCPFFGILLSPMIAAAAAMNMSSVSVAGNARGCGGWSCKKNREGQMARLVQSSGREDGADLSQENGSTSMFVVFDLPANSLFFFFFLFLVMNLSPIFFLRDVLTSFLFHERVGVMGLMIHSCHARNGDAKQG